MNDQTLFLDFGVFLEKETTKSININKQEPGAPIPGSKRKGDGEDFGIYRKSGKNLNFVYKLRKGGTTFYGNDPRYHSAD